MTNPIIAREEARYNGHPVTVSTVRLLDDPRGREVYETMILRRNGMDEWCRHSYDEADALAAHKMALKICTETEEARPLSGKYAQLAEALRKAAATAQAYKDHEDGGTCNFDAPSLYLPRYTEAEIKRAAWAARLSCFSWKICGKTRWVFSVPISGQGNRRTEAAEAMTRELEALGYDALTYYQMD